MIFLDSSFIIALYSIRDQYHKEARKLMEDIANKEFGDVFISDYIFDEVTTFLLKNLGLTETVKICNALFEATYIMNVDESLFKKTFDMFEKQKNSELSFTDCTNIVVMAERGIKNLATFDEDFRLISSINNVSGRTENR